MCQKCNEALIAASQAALNLSRAAKNLYDMNASAQADTLAKAAAELFEIVEPRESATIKEEVSARAEADTAAAGKGSPENESKEPGKHPLESLLDALLLGGDTKPQAFRIEDGIVYVGGQPLGRVVVMGGPKPTKH